ncbi:MAG: SpaA isopeptide-forming pilin-related protein [Corynebacterium sp.]|nr:SpaA isopeptide-forming pilin-related protein [Corynebacterium sp.]
MQQRQACACAFCVSPQVVGLHLACYLSSILASLVVVIGMSPAAQAITSTPNSQVETSSALPISTDETVTEEVSSTLEEPTTSLTEIEEFRAGFGGFAVEIPESRPDTNAPQDDAAFRVHASYELPEGKTVEDYPNWVAPGNVDREGRGGAFALNLQFGSTEDSPELPAGTTVTLEFPVTAASHTPQGWAWSGLEFDPDSFEIGNRERREFRVEPVLRQGEKKFSVELRVHGTDKVAREEFHFGYECGVNGESRRGNFALRANEEPFVVDALLPVGTKCAVRASKETVLPGVLLVTAPEDFVKEFIVGSKTHSPDAEFEFTYEDANQLNMVKRPFDQRSVVAKVESDGSGKFTARYRLEFTNTRTGPVVLDGEVFDDVAFPAGISIEQVEIRDTEKGDPISGIVVDPQEEREDHVFRRTHIPGAVIGRVDAGKTKTLFVDVVATASREALGSMKDVECIGPDPSAEEAKNPSGLQNSLIVPETIEDLDGPDNNHACINLALPKVSVEHKPRPGKPVTIYPNGHGELEYEIHVRNNERRTNANVATLKEELGLADIEVVGDATVTAKPDNGVVISDVRETIPVADVVGEFDIATGIELPARTGVTFTLKLPIKVSAPRESVGLWGRLRNCYQNPDGNFEGGVQARVNIPFDSDGPGNNVACIPVQPPELPTLKLAKVDYDKEPLPGAEFFIFPDKNGGIGCAPVNGANPVPINPEEPNVAIITLAPGKYHLIETKAPKSHSLLARPVPFEITPTEDGLGYRIKLVAETDEYVVSPDGMNLRVANTLSGELPDTGGHGPAHQILLGLLVVLLGSLVLHRYTTTTKAN